MPSTFARLAAAACVAVLSASQDIAIDAWRIETFTEREQGLALAVYVWGYRIALLVSTTGVIAAAARTGGAKGPSARSVSSLGTTRANQAPECRRALLCCEL